jgi:hypothetical protein
MSEEEEPKLIIDEDWKSQVQREKEEFKRKQASEDADLSQASASSPSESGWSPSESPSNRAEQPRQGAESDQQLPPASFPMLIASLGTQAMAALGQLAMEEGEAPVVNLEFARHFIDLLGVLEEKTKGNLAPEEDRYLHDTLHQLRIAFVEIKSRMAT